MSCSVSAGLLDICIKCCVFLGAGCLLNFSPSWWGEETKSGFEEGSTSGTLVVTGHAHGEEPRQWVEHFKKGEVVEELIMRDYLCMSVVTLIPKQRRMF